MEKDVIYSQLVLAEKQQGLFQMSERNFDRSEYPIIIEGLKILKRRGILITENNNVPCLNLGDTKALEARQSEFGSTFISDNFSFEFPDLKKAHIAELAYSLDKHGPLRPWNEPIRVCFDTDSDMIRPIIEIMSKEEGIVLRQE